MVQSDQDFSERLRRRLEQDVAAGVEVLPCGELSEAMARLSRGGIDVVLLGLDLPDSSGIVTFERTHAFAPEVPIVVVCDEPSAELSLAVVQGGAQDCVAKSEASPAVVARIVRHAVERNRLLSALRALSLIDDLTGLYNRRGFVDIGAQYLDLGRRSGRAATLVCLDLDRFKTINDTLGHHIGDRVLQKVADIVRATFRTSDISARLSGDSFAVLALESCEDTPELMLSRLRTAFRDFNRRTRAAYHLSASVGMARSEEERRVRLTDLLEKADAEMFAEKRAKHRAVLGGA